MGSFEEGGRRIFHHGNWAKDELGKAAIVKIETIRAKCLERSELWEDESFPPNLNSIGQIDNDSKKDLSQLVWMRAPDIGRGACFLNGPLNPGLVIQGSAGTCYFLAALAVLTRQPELFHLSCPEQSFNHEYCGAFIFRFYKWGRWLEVVIDDYLPTLNGELFFAKGSDKNELLVPLAEKAYAKLLGSYAVAEGGFTASALVELTGGVGWFEMLDPKKAISLFETIEKMDCKDAYFGATVLKRGKQTSGIQHRHAYGILGARWVPKGTVLVPLLKMYNPWGGTEWTGPWGDKCPNWSKVPAHIKEQLHFAIRDEGIFWVELKDFLSLFTLLDACIWRVPPSEPGTHVAHGRRWEVQTLHGVWPEGGNEAPVERQPRLRLALFERSAKKVTVSISQRHPRADDDVPVTIRVLRLAEQDRAKKLTANVLARAETMTTTKDDMPEVKTTFIAEKGRGHVLVFTSDSPQQSKFFARVYAEPVPKARRPMLHLEELGQYLAKEHMGSTLREGLLNLFKKDLGKF